MALLFADTTYDITLGLLSEELSWLDFRSHKGQKASAVLQKEAHDICQTQGIRPLELTGIITCAGPGFYTGLRLTEGLADIFKIFNVPSYSFYTYEIPRLCGLESGVWVTKAYRGEYFFHEWQGEETKNTLVSAKDLSDHLKKFQHVYIHSLGAMDQELGNYTLTIDLLKQKPETILSEVVRKKFQRESFYFRAPEDEFRVSV